MLAHRQTARVDGFYRSHQPEDNTFSEVLQDGKNYVEIQGRFSSDGKFVGGSYVPEVLDRLMGDVYYTLGQAESLYRLRVTVEMEDLGAEVKFGKSTHEKAAVETQVPTVPRCVTAGKLIPAQSAAPATVDPAPEVVA